MAEALINSKLLSWARGRAQMDIAHLATALKASPTQIQSWEVGETRPSFSKAMDIAKVLHVPLGYLFLSKPPEEKISIPDLRTVADGEKKSLSIDFRDVLQGTMLKQQWFEEFRRTEGNGQHFPVAEVSNHISEGEIAHSIRNALGWSDETRRESGGPGEYLTALVKKAEALGILVMRSGVVGSNNNRSLSVSEFRGFALANDVAPIIFINSNDAKTAQVFTFAHELAHIWFGRSGVSNPELVAFTGKGYPLELRCNSIAANLVAPAVDMVTAWKSKGTAGSVAGYFRVSEIVILRRALDLRLIDEVEFKQKISAIPKRVAKKGKGGNFHTTLVARNSPLFTQTLLGEVKRGSVTYREAARLLNIKPSTISKLGKKKGSS